MRDRAAHPILLIVLFGLAGCAMGPVPLEEREAKPLPATDVTGGFFETQVTARPLGEIESSPDADRLRLALGEDSEATCWFFREELNLATGLALFSASRLKDVENVVGPLQSSHVAGISAGAAGGRPYLSLDWGFFVEQEGEPREGRLRALLGSTGGHSIACVHNGFGYRATLERVFGELLIGTRFGGPGAAVPYYGEVDVIERDGAVIGVQTMQVVRDPEGDSEITSETAILLRTATDELATYDSLQIEFSKPDGRLINAFRGDIEGGQVGGRMELRPIRGGGWRLKGSYRGEEVDESLPAAELRSSLGLILAVRKAIESEGAGATGKLMMWDPELGVLAIHELSFRIQEHLPDDSYRVILRSGPRTVHGVTDASGSMRAREIAVGAEGMTLRRIHQQGEP